MNSFFDVWPFPLLKKKTMKRNISFLSRQMYFQARLLQPRQAATKAGMNRLHVVTVFNFPGAARNARRIGNIKPIQHKYLTNFRSNISYTLHRNVSSQWLYNYEYLVHERIGVPLRRNLDFSRGRNCSVR